MGYNRRSFEVELRKSAFGKKISQDREALIACVVNQRIRYSVCRRPGNKAGAGFGGNQMIETRSAPESGGQAKFG
jgi:hypothetical protein